jgi:hypothetical protein
VQFFLNATRTSPISPGGPLERVWRWFIVDFLGTYREMHISDLPPPLPELKGITP